MLEQRLKLVQQTLKSQNIDAIFITNNINIHYISGFKGTSGYIIVTQNEAVLFTDSRYIEQANNQAKYFTVIQHDNDLCKSINEIIEKYKIETILFESAYMVYNDYNKYKEKLKLKKFISSNGLIEEIRIIKDENEIKKMQKAANIADSAFSHILSYIKKGITEKEIAIEMEYFMKKNGASDLSFDTIVASGKRSSLPHGAPTDKIIESNDMITMDFGCIYEGYCSDMTRTVFMDSISDKQKEIYNTVLEAQRRGLEILKSDISCNSVDAAARNYIEENGYGKYFGHGLGHGVGLEIHEQPRVSPSGDEILKPGMIVTVEPGIYIPDFGGVRIEDMVCIEKDGIRNFTTSSKEIVIL